MRDFGPSTALVPASPESRTICATEVQPNSPPRGGANPKTSTVKRSWDNSGADCMIGLYILLLAGCVGILALHDEIREALKLLADHFHPDEEAGEEAEQ